MFKKLRQKIESKRNSDNIFWKTAVFVKDFCFRLIDAFMGDRSEKRSENYHEDINHEKKIYESFRNILKTPAIECNQDSPVEIHTVTSHYHIFMYITAIKSLLRFYNDLAVVIHEYEPIFTEQDRRILKKQIPGIKIISKEDSDRKMNIILKKYPCCRKYRKGTGNSLELLDNIILAEKKKIITINSDILFLQRPEELIDWIKNSKNKIIYIYEKDPVYQAEFLKIVGSNFPPHVVLAMVCFYKDILDLNYVEKIIKKMSWRYNYWFLGQLIYPLLIEKKSNIYDADNFDKEKNAASGIFREGDIFRHYCASKDFFYDIHIKDAKKIMTELKKISIGI